MIRFFKLIFLWAALSHSNLTFSQNIKRSFISDSLDSYIEQGLKEWKIPGLAVCIVKDTQVVFIKGYGIKKSGQNDRVDVNTLFMIGSNTKAFTGTALAMLHEEKKLSLDDKVVKWIPEFKLDNKLAGDEATIRDLLCHRLGFEDYQGDFTFYKSNLIRAEVIEKMGHLKAVYSFRTNFGYCNAGFLTAGEIIPKVTGIQWENYLKDKFFVPLGMARTYATIKEIPETSNKAFPHTQVDRKIITPSINGVDNLAPAGSITSTATDLAKWLILHLNNGKYEGKQIVPADAIKAVANPVSIAGNGGVLFNRGHFSLYGLGFGIEEYEGRKVVCHTGGITGFKSSVTLIPEEKIGIVVLTNSDENLFYYALKQEITDAYLKLPYRNYSKILLDSFYLNKLADKEGIDKKMRDSVQLKLKTELPLKEYTGSFFNDVYGDMNVILENGNLKMIFSHHPKMYAKLEPIGKNRFYASFTDPEFYKAIFPFKVINGKVKSVTVKVADFIEHTPYEFIKK